MSGRVLIALLLAAQLATAGPLDDLAEEAIAAYGAGDAEALAAITKTRWDPWSIADEILRRGKYEAALAFAESASDAALLGLPAYVESRKGKPYSTATYEARRTASEMYRAGDAQGALEALLDAPVDAGDVSCVVLLGNRGQLFNVLRRPEDMVNAYRESAEAAERIGWAAQAFNMRWYAGLARYDILKQVEEAQEDWSRALEHAARLSDPDRAALVHDRVAKALVEQRRFDAAIAHYEELLRYWRDVKGDRNGLAGVLDSIGLAHQWSGRYERALSFMQSALELYEAGGNREQIGRELMNIGVLYDDMQEYPTAFRFYERALPICEELKIERTLPSCLANMGMNLVNRGRFSKALEYQHRALALLRKDGTPSDAVTELNNIGLSYKGLGEYEQALAHFREAAEKAGPLGMMALRSKAMLNMGNVHFARGEYAHALARYDESATLMRELKDRGGEASAITNLANVHLALGDPDRALALARQALAIDRELGKKAAAAIQLTNVGEIARARGDHETALENYEEARQVLEGLEAREALVHVLDNIGTAHLHLSHGQDALRMHRRALELATEIDHPEMIALVHGSLGRDYEAGGEVAEAARAFERGLAMAREVGALPVEASALTDLTRLHLNAGEPDAAIQAAREAVALMPSLVGGVGAQEGALAREVWVELFSTATRAAVAAGKVEDALFFLESGRAGALLEALHARDSLRETSLSPEMRAREAQDRADEAVALRACREALATKERKPILAARTALDAARERMAVTVAEIQRKQRAAADVLYPKAATLPDIRASLGAHDALVLYSMLEDDAVALVVRRDAAELRKLGPAGNVREAVAGLRCDDPAAAVDFEPLRKLVVAPLGLAEDASIVVSPHGELASVPFAALLDGRELSYAPSGTTLRLLREQEAPPGDQVLAIGDPEYGEGSAVTQAILRRSGPLVRLPATGEEAKAVGSKVLLRADASKQGLLDALRERPRWRAVHFACHGLVDTERPMFSSLALANGDFLTTLDLFRLKIPADLVVLSACDTARGKVYLAEGVVGFTRAFMFAGCPRVIVSLWKVDDEATRALMVRFYSLWNPEDGRGIGAAAALRKAQQHVAAQKKWRHPYYWAAWQLWGLSD